MVDDNAVVLRVCLAKRDRHLDGNEKRYDYRTGQRIYDKFEAPDLDEDDEADDDHDNTGIDEGFREVPWVCAPIYTASDQQRGDKSCRIMFLRLICTTVSKLS